MNYSSKTIFVFKPRMKIPLHDNTETIMEDGVTIKDNEEAILHSSIRGYHIAIVQIWRIENVLVRESSYDASGQLTPPTIKYIITTL